MQGRSKSSGRNDGIQLIGQQALKQAEWEEGLKLANRMGGLYGRLAGQMWASSGAQAGKRLLSQKAS